VDFGCYQAIWIEVIRLVSPSTTQPEASGTESCIDEKEITGTQNTGSAVPGIIPRCRMSFQIPLVITLIPLTSLMRVKVLSDGNEAMQNDARLHNGLNGKR
jgi:hypothetical protein